MTDITKPPKPSVLKGPVTSFDVARKAGVSRSTVSIVINNTPGIVISEKTRQAVWDAIRELNYHPNTIARSMRSNRSRMLGLIIGIHPTSHFLSHLLAGIQETITENNYSIVLAGTGTDDRQMAQYAALYLKKQVDGFIVALYTSRTDAVFLAPLKSEGIPLVVVNSGFDDTEVGHVDYDYELGAAEATRHLISLGHRHIALLAIPRTGKAMTKSIVQRREGYRAAMDAAGLEPLVMENAEVRTRPNRQNGYDMGRLLLERHSDVTACYCLSDWAAVGLMDAAREIGIRLPDDLAIVGSDNLPGVQFTTPTLSSVARPHHEAGKTAAAMLIRHLEERSQLAVMPERVLLPCRLVLRDSSGRIR